MIRPAHHLLAFAGSVASGASLANLGKLTDQIFNSQSSGYTSIESYRILRAYFQCPDVTKVQIDSPTLRLIGPQQISPFSVATAPSDDPPIAKFDRNARVIPKQDFFNVQVTRSVVAAANGYCLLWMGKSMPAKDDRVCMSVEATSTVTIAALGWTQGTLNFTQQLPPGRYAIIGLAAWGTNLLAARLMFPNQTERPGCIAQQAAGEFLLDDYRYGNFGVLGEFTNDAPPLIECLGMGAGTTQTYIFDVVPLEMYT